MRAQITLKERDAIMAMKKRPAEAERTQALSQEVLRFKLEVRNS